MPRLAAALYLALVLVTVAWRSWLQYRRTGDHGLRIPAAGAPALERVASALFMSAALLTLLSPLLVLAGITSIPAAAQRPALHASGAVLASGGVLLVAIAQLQMGASWRIGVDRRERTALVTGGLFGVVRNPIFTGILLFGTGLVLLVPQLLTLLGAAVGLVSIELQVRRVEEPHLDALHGAAYRRYASRVGRFLPGLGRLPSRTVRSPEPDPREP